MEAAAKAAIEKEQEAADKAWAERASRLAIEIAQRLAARLEGPTVHAAFLDWLIKEIRTLPEPARQAVAANGVTLEAISATPIEPAEQEHYRELIGEAFGSHPRIAFKIDPTLIAGLELLGPHLVVSNSWRADLTQIFADLTHDHRSDIRADAWLEHARAKLGAAALGPQTEQIGRVEEIGDGIALVSGLPDVRLDELLRFRQGTVRLCPNGRPRPGRLCSARRC